MAGTYVLARFAAAAETGAQLSAEMPGTVVNVLVNARRDLTHCSGGRHDRQPGGGPAA